MVLSLSCCCVGRVIIHVVDSTHDCSHDHSKSTCGIVFIFDTYIDMEHGLIPTKLKARLEPSA